MGIVSSSSTWAKKPSTINRSASGRRDPARHQVEQLVRVYLPERGTVGAAHIVRLDLQLRDAVRAGFVREQQVRIALVGIGLLRVRAYMNQAAIDSACRIPQAEFEQQIRHAIALRVILQRLIAEQLLLDRQT